VNLFWSLLATLALTLVVELAVAAALGLRTRRALLAVACVNLITNPPLNLLLTLVSWWRPWAYAPALIALEIVVVIVEWRLLLWALGGDARRMLLVAAAMNAASLALGFLLWLV
jgi:hypothetical protein